MWVLKAAASHPSHRPKTQSLFDVFSVTLLGSFLVAMFYRLSLFTWAFTTQETGSLIAEPQSNHPPKPPNPGNAAREILEAKARFLWPQTACADAKVLSMPNTPTTPSD